eukprot:876994-Prorocentrum_lima.AAC.1
MRHPYNRGMHYRTNKHEHSVDMRDTAAYLRSTPATRIAATWALSLSATFPPLSARYAAGGCGTARDRGRRH